MPEIITGCILITKKVGAVTEFYEKVFDWKFAGTSNPRDYVTVDIGDGRGGLVMNQAYDVEPLVWLPCVEVVDIEATLEKVLKNHGSVVLGAKPMPDKNGPYAVIADPKGAQIAVRQIQ